MSKVLIVDKSIDRKKRIAALKEQGFSVFPALQAGRSTQPLPAWARTTSSS